MGRCCARRMVSSLVVSGSRTGAVESALQKGPAQAWPTRGHGDRIVAEGCRIGVLAVGSAGTVVPAVSVLTGGLMDVNPNRRLIPVATL